MPKTLPLNEVRARAAEFARRWSALMASEADRLGSFEKRHDQEFVRDLLGVFGQVEKQAVKWQEHARRIDTAGRGWVDALIPGVAAIEVKSPGKSLIEAERQALAYLPGLPDKDSPQFVLTTDFHHFRLLDRTAKRVVEPVETTADDGGERTAKFEGGAGAALGIGSVIEFDLAELPAHAERLQVLAGYEMESPTAAQAEVSVQASRLMGELYEAMSSADLDDHDASVFLIRVLFCLFADDAQMEGWPRGIFEKYLKTQTSESGQDVGALLYRLFRRLDKNRDPGKHGPSDELLAKFPYVDGDIFAEKIDVPEFDKKMRDVLLKCCAFNWANISPAIFGSLFQTVKDKRARREMGEHYTTETNIMRLIGPMFLDGLNERLEQAQGNAADLRALRRELGAMRFLDPACGCGNFLVVAYRELRGIELRILERLQHLQGIGAGGRTAKTKFELSLVFEEDSLEVKASHFYGIEIEEWPAQIARTALHLADHQANLAMIDALGRGPATLPLTKINTITQANALRTDWEKVTGATKHLFIFGNPPFVGQYTKQAHQTDDMKLVWGKLYDGYLDYVTAWFKKSVDPLGRPSMGGEFGFVSTNSITQGQPVPTLFGYIFDHGWRIRFAHRTFAWASEAPGAAAVHCVITEFYQPGKRRRRPPEIIYDYHHPKDAEPTAIPVEYQINPYLLDAPTVLVHKAMRPLNAELPPAEKGSSPVDGGHLLIEPADYGDVVADQFAAKYVQPFKGARDLIQGSKRWCLWLPSLDPADLRRSPILKGRVEAVQSFRAASKRTQTRKAAETPTLFGEIRQPHDAYVATPRVVSETRRFFTVAYESRDVILSDSNFTAIDPDGLAFSLLSSSAFIAWQRAIGGRLESRLRFSNTLTWNTFPLPAVSDKQRAAIIQGGKQVLAARDLHPEWSLAQHYDPLAMRPELLQAHAHLDKAVDAVFGLNKPTEAERLAALFTSYQRLTSPHQ